MSPRRKTVEDHEIVAATGRVIGRVGPAKLTLALVAEEVGLAPATLVQRFGSKRGLLLALGQSGDEDRPEFLDGLRSKHASPLAVLREFLLCFARMAETPDQLANHLAAFQMDLVDPELCEVTRRITLRNESTVRELLREALDAGEIRGGSPKKLAPVLLAVVHGSLSSWAVFRHGSARAWLKRHLDTALAPYRTEES